jgi:hypothetical protein
MQIAPARTHSSRSAPSEEAVERVMMGVRLVEDGLDPAAIGEAGQVSKLLSSGSALVRPRAS